MLLSVDWDAFSGTRALVFDAPIWGTPDREYDRLPAWRDRALKRSGANSEMTGWDALDDDFPLYPGWEALLQYAGRPSWVTLSHADAWAWLDFFAVQDVLNVDSHHDLGSLSGDRTRIRPGNWAGLALQAGKITAYTCRYPSWHETLPVAEGFDLQRTRGELQALLNEESLARVTLERSGTWPAAAEVQGLLLVQSPAWTNPAHDAEFHQLAQALSARTLTPCLTRQAAQLPGSSARLTR